MQNSLSKLLENVDTFPVMGEILEEYNTLVLDLSPANPDLEKLDL